MKIEAVKVRRLYLDVANQIENLVNSGQIIAGDRLPSERDLASQFGVSRPTIREAMIVLEIAGLVEIRTGSGIYALDKKSSNVKPIEDEGPGAFEILEARRLVESEIIELAAARISNRQLADLEDALADMEREDAEGSVTENADRRFHCIIAEASGNSALSAMVKWLWDMRLSSGLSTLFHQRVREMGVHPSVEQHRRIFKALERRDPQGAKIAMLDHITRSIQDSEDLLEQ